MVDEYGVAHMGKCGVPCDGVTNIDPWVQTELAAGATSFWLPADTVWTPPRNYIPEGLIVRGANWKTVVIKAANPEKDYIIVGPGVQLYDLSILDVVEPGIAGFGSKSLRPVRQYLNLCNGDQIPTHYAWTGISMNVSGTGQDLNALTINGRGVGDVVFGGANQSATWLHVEVNGEDIEAAGIGASLETYGRGLALHVTGRPTARPAYALVRIEQRGKGPSLMIEPDEDGEGIVVMLDKDGAGRCFHVYHHKGTNSGSPIALNMGRDGAKYIGNPIWYKNGDDGPMLFQVMNDGRVESEQMTTLERRIAEIETKLAAGRDA